MSMEESKAAFNGHIITCDSCYCHLAPSNGGRYKCMICNDYDLCAQCFVRRTHNNHAFVHLINGDTELPGCYLQRIGSMTNHSQVSEEESAEAFNGLAYFCDLCDCNIAPSNGGRFKCMICNNFDLCAACFVKGTHDNHAFVHLRNGETTVPDNMIRHLNNQNNQPNISHQKLRNAKREKEKNRRNAILAAKYKEMEEKHSEMAAKFEKMKQERDELVARDGERERKYRKMLIMIGRDKKSQ